MKDKLRSEITHLVADGIGTETGDHDTPRDVVENIIRFVESHYISNEKLRTFMSDAYKYIETRKSKTGESDRLANRVLRELAYFIGDIVDGRSLLKEEEK